MHMSNKSDVFKLQQGVGAVDDKLRITIVQFEGANRYMVCKSMCI